MGRRKQQAHEKAARARSGKAKKAAQSASHDESTARKRVSLAGDVGGIAGDSDNTAPTALECDWEHRMVRWMHAYRSGLGAKEAQTHVKDFSSRKYASHRRVPECLACQFDA